MITMLTKMTTMALMMWIMKGKCSHDDNKEDKDEDSHKHGDEDKKENNDEEEDGDKKHVIAQKT